MQTANKKKTVVISLAIAIVVIVAVVVTVCLCVLVKGDKVVTVDAEKVTGATVEFNPTPYDHYSAEIDAENTAKLVRELRSATLRRIDRMIDQVGANITIHTSDGETFTLRHLTQNVIVVDGQQYYLQNDIDWFTDIARDLVWS